MGCVPPQKNSRSIPPTNVTATNHKGGSSKNGTPRGGSQGKKKTEGVMSPRSSQQSIGATSIRRYKSGEGKERESTQVIRVLPPTASQPKVTSKEDYSSISIKSLDIHSKISSPNKKNTNAREAKVVAPVGASEPVGEITFNNNNFAVAHSSGYREGRADVLRREVRDMNEERFRKIKVDNMNFE